MTATTRLCSRCGADTLRLREFAYMVEDSVWRKACRRAQVSRLGFLCIGCLEEVLGRSLEPLDFKWVPLTWSPAWRRSPRLLHRIGAGP